MTDILCQRTEDDASTYVKRSNEIFLKFKRLLVSNYRKHHNIQFYADKLNISTTYLSRIVKRITGRTVYSHISELICVEAKRLLECSDKDVKEISDWLGFSDQSVFGKFFLKRTGLSPMKYRTMRLGNWRKNGYAEKGDGILTKKLRNQWFQSFLAVRTGLEPVTPCVTGMYSNQLN